jgi:hypothetical protein
MSYDIDLTHDHPRMRHIIGNAIRWHLTGFDAANGRGLDADGVDQHGWDADEQFRIAEIVRNPALLADVLHKWFVFDMTKPEIMQNESDRDDIVTMLVNDPYFQVDIGELRL